MRSFKKWLFEGKDIFGFERENEKFERKKDSDDNPILYFSLEEMMNRLCSYEVGIKEPNLKFINEIHWGENTGAIRVRLGTAFNLMIERCGFDLTGNKRWYTKKCYQINQNNYGGFEDAVADEIIEEVRKIDKSKLDSATSAWEGCEKMVIEVASKVRRTAKEIFIFEGVRKNAENQYILRLGVGNQGVETQDQRRVLENQTTIVYMEKEGIIRISNTNIESDVGKAPSWEIQPQDTDYYFAPTQSNQEIAECLATTLHWY